jgi:acetate kinase
VLIAHLGSGASLAAVLHGQPMDTTMGFSPLGGLMMSTRPGDLDPGVLLYLVTAGYTPTDLSELLNKKSGLVGVSELSPSMETLLLRAADDPRAADAIELFAYQIRKHAGAMIAVLGGLDMFVFTGGIGEHAAKIRSLVVDGLSHFGIRLEEAKNATDADIISQRDSPVTVRVIPTDESLVIARHVRALVKKSWRS